MISNPIEPKLEALLEIIEQHIHSPAQTPETVLRNAKILRAYGEDIGDKETLGQEYVQWRVSLAKANLVTEEYLKYIIKKNGTDWTFLVNAEQTDSPAYDAPEGQRTYKWPTNDPDHQRLLDELREKATAMSKYISTVFSSTKEYEEIKDIAKRKLTEDRGKFDGWRNVAALELQPIEKASPDELAIIVYHITVEKVREKKACALKEPETPLTESTLSYYGKITQPKRVENPIAMIGLQALKYLNQRYPDKEHINQLMLRLYKDIN